MITSVKMKLGNVFVILMFKSIQGGRSQAPPELQCYYCKTGDYPPDPVGWVPKCGDFGNLTQPFGVVTCPRGGGCGKETGKTLGGEKYTFHNCSENMSHHGEDGCWKVFNSETGKGKKKQCRCSTDL